MCGSEPSNVCRFTYYSIYSDSSRTPENIVYEAKNKQVSILSVCNHYTIASYERLEYACRQNNVSFVSGIEMDAILNGENYHVLAYHFDKQNQQILDFKNRQYVKSQNECEAMITKISADYPQLSLVDYSSR